jgi:hypothetical protein
VLVEQKVDSLRVVLVGAIQALAEAQVVMVALAVVLAHQSLQTLYGVVVVELLVTRGMAVKAESIMLTTLQQVLGVVAVVAVVVILQIITIVLAVAVE